MQPGLLSSICNQRWTDAIERLRNHPDEFEYRQYYSLDEIYFTTALHKACEYDPPVGVIDAMLAAYPDATTSKDNDGDTPLHIASWYASAEVVKRLLTANMTPLHMVNNDGKTPLQEMAFKVEVTMCTISFTQPLCLQKVVDNASLIVKASYHQTTQEPLPDGKVWRILHAFIGVPDCPMVFVERIITLNSKQMAEVDEKGNLPLHIAAAMPESSHKADIMKRLIEVYPAATKIRDRRGHLALHIACSATRVVHEQSDDNDDKNHNGKQSEGERRDGDNVINLLVKAYPSATEMPNEVGRLPLHIVCENGRRWKAMEGDGSLEQRLSFRPIQWRLKLGMKKVVYCHLCSALLETTRP